HRVRGRNRRERFEAARVVPQTRGQRSVARGAFDSGRGSDLSQVDRMSHHWVYPDVEHAAVAAAKSILGLLEERLSGEAQATLAISGGKSPALMFDLMVKERFNWSDVHLFWVD